jgi:hypothetical protein
MTALPNASRAGVNDAISEVLDGKAKAWLVLEP